MQRQQRQSQTLGRSGIRFIDSWQKVGPEEAHKRAKRYLTAMPAWAHKAESDLS